VFAISAATGAGAAALMQSVMRAIEQRDAAGMDDGHGAEDDAGDA
jgi:hypothetical protein